MPASPPRALVCNPRSGWELAATVVTSANAETASLDAVRTALLRAVHSSQAEHARMTGWGARLVFPHGGAGVRPQGRHRLPDLDF